MAGFVPFSDTIPWSSEWQNTLWFALLLLIPLSLATARKGGAGATKFLSSWAVPITLLLGVGVLFDWASVSTYPVHSSGVVVVTGASSGIGRAAAIALTTKGFTVYAGVRKESDAESIRAEGIASLHPLMLDVTSTESIAHAAEEIAKTGQPLVALVNNAGITSNLPLEIVPMATFKRNYDVNVFGLLETTQHFAAMLRESKGRIVNVGSVGGSVVFPGMAPYISSKFAVEGLTDGMRQEMLDHGVSVSLVRPGVIKTEIFGKMLSNTKASGVTEEVTAQLAAGHGSNVTKELYRKTVEALVAVAKMTPYDPMASGVEITDAAILHAVTSPFPKCRYHVGPDAIMLTALNDYLLPDRVFDCFVNWFVSHGGWVMQHGNVIDGEVL